MDFEKEQIRAMRRGCSRIGVALLAHLAVTYLFVILIEVWLAFVFPRAAEDMTIQMVISDLCTYGLGGVVLWLILRPLPRAWPAQRSMTPRRFGKLTVESIGAMYSLSLITTLIVTALSSLTQSEWSNALDDMLEDMPLATMFLFVVVVAPICEELLFRKILFRHLLPFGQKFAVVVSGLAFGLFHCNIYQFFYATALGMMFGCIVAKTGQIRYTILIHAIVNLLGSVVITALEPWDIALAVYALGIYALMAVGLVVLILDRKSLIPSGQNLPGCRKAALTAPFWMLCVIVYGYLSVALASF